MYDPVGQKAYAKQNEDHIVDPFFLKETEIKHPVDAQHRHRPNHTVHLQRAYEVQLQRKHQCTGQTTTGTSNVPLGQHPCKKVAHRTGQTKIPIYKNRARKEYNVEQFFLPIMNTQGNPPILSSIEYFRIIQYFSHFCNTALGTKNRPAKGGGV